MESKTPFKSDSRDALLPLLVLLALFIWFRDRSWISSSDDTLPILISLPLFYWLAMPWEWNSHPSKISIPKIALSVFFFLAGIAVNSTLSLTIGWILLFWTWLDIKTSPAMHQRLFRLLPLLLMAFPWISLDADRVGWWFRLSGAWFAEHFFALVGMDVTREGTLMVLNGFPISVEVACAGLNTLQSMLIAGTVVAFLILGHTSRYWWNIPLLFIMSWVSNTIRIILISWAAVKISPKFATGEIHIWGGWAILLLMFCFCWFIFSLQEPRKESAT